MAADDNSSRSGSDSAETPRAPYRASSRARLRGEEKYQRRSAGRTAPRTAAEAPSTDEPALPRRRELRTDSLPLTPEAPEEAPPQAPEASATQAPGAQPPAPSAAPAPDADAAAPPSSSPAAPTPLSSAEKPSFDEVIAADAPEDAEPRHAARTGFGQRAQAVGGAAAAGAAAAASAIRSRTAPHRERLSSAGERLRASGSEQLSAAGTRIREAGDRVRSAAESRRALRRREQEQAAAPETASAATPATTAAPANTAADAGTGPDSDHEAPRHFRREGDGFARVVGWTALGTLLPGLAFLRKRETLLGRILLGGFLGGILILAAYVLVRGPVRAVARIVSSPTILYLSSALLILGLLIWLFVVFRSYALMRRGERFTPVQKGLGGVLVASLALCVGIPTGVGAYYAKVQGDTVVTVFGKDGGKVEDKANLWKDKPRINVFLIGRDNGDGREGTRPDTMLVASIDTRSGDATLISVPRNLAMPRFPEDSPLAERFPEGFDAFGRQESLINAVWTWADEYPEDVPTPRNGVEPGMEATMQAVEGSLGLSLDYYASVDMAGFEDVVDAIGGVQIDVERPIPMGGGTNLNTGMKNRIRGWIDPGPQTLDGKHALWYVRSREGADNYDRMCRQQRMLKTTLDQVDPQELAVAYPKLAGSAEKNIQTDISQSQVAAFLELVVSMQRAEIKSAQINNDVVNTVSPDYEKLHSWVDEQINPKEPEQGSEPKPAETDAPSEEPTPTPEPTETEPAAGIETDDGKCYPRGYEPGMDWPGYPGPNGGDDGTQP